MSIFDRKSQPLSAHQSPNQEALNYLAEHELETYVLRLYVASNSLRSLRAIQRIQKLCEERLPGRYELEIVDIYQDPERLEQDQVFAVPTLIKQLPPPLQRLIGDMTDMDKLITCLDL
ncbi:MAG: thiol-disulfide isomerase [Cyanobacteria bacterium Co-bin13]|nr:thiol-disulfide isomerase [Cyanobacteria bacterium Co-bin13]